MDNQAIVWGIFAIIFVMMVLPILVMAPIFRMWLMCTMAGAPIGVMNIVGMRLRRSPAKHLCELYIMTKQAGLDVKISQLESAYRAGADVELAVRAMIKASRIGQNLSWEEAEQKAMTDQYDEYVEENYGDGE